MDQQPAVLEIDVACSGADLHARVTGELDLSNTDQLLQALEGARGQHLVVDLSGLSFMDSSGINALLTLRAAAGTLRVVQPSNVVAKVLHIAGVYELFCEPAPPT